MAGRLTFTCRSKSEYVKELNEKQATLTNPMSLQSRRILPAIVVSQFCCTSLWFAGNAVMDDLVNDFHLTDSALGHLTSAVQFGFICGTLVFALLTIADRFSPSRVFLVSAIVAAIFNLGALLETNTLISLLSFRFFTGFFLAGIYPVGMKIAADYFERGLGKSLGYLVGALVVGTAFPHFLKGYAADLPWKNIFIMTSSLAILGGLLMVLLVPDGPYRKVNQKPDLTAFLKVFKNRDFRSAACGYFGHMWELYAFWAFVPVMLGTYQFIHPQTELNIPVTSFVIIGFGGLACVFGGFISETLGARKTAAVALALSGTCCLVSPIIFIAPPTVFAAFLIFWGMVVIADSPLFSSLVAQYAPPESKGTALTIVNCVGFSITIVSIQFLTLLQPFMPPEYLYLVLAGGPILGLVALRDKRRST